MSNADKIAKAAPLDFPRRERRSRREAGYRYQRPARDHIRRCKIHGNPLEAGRCCTCDYIAGKEQDRQEMLNWRSIIEQPPRNRRARQDPEFRSTPRPASAANPFYDGMMDDWPDWGLCKCGARRRQDARGVGCPDCKARLSPKEIHAAIMAHRAKARKKPANP